MIDIVVTAIMQIILMSLPFLLIGLLISTGIGFFQAITQVQDATVSFVPKLVLLLLLLVIGMPWFLQMMSEYSRDLFQNIVISSEST